MNIHINSGVDRSLSPNEMVGTSGIPLKKRRKRTNLDATQRSALDRYFSTNPRPDHEKMAEIANKLDLERDVS